MQISPQEMCLTCLTVKKNLVSASSRILFVSVKQTKHHAPRPHSKSPEKEELAIA